MPTPMTTEERAIRNDMDRAVRRVRSALGRCPAIENLDLVDTEALAVAETNDALVPWRSRPAE